MNQGLIKDMLFIIIFILPGLFIKYILQTCVPTDQKEYDYYEKNLRYIALSLITLVLNVFILEYFFDRRAFNLSTLLEYFTSIKFLLKYLLLTMADSFFIAFCIWLYRDKIKILLINIWNKNCKQLEITNKHTMWEEMFENPEMIKDRVIRIEKDGKIVAQGIVDKFTAPGQKKTQVLLIYSQEVEKYFNSIIKRNEIYDAFIEYVLYDVEQGMTVKFYHSEPIIEYISLNRE